MLVNTELMPFKKYVQAILRKIYHEDTIRLNGTFKDIVTGQIVENDIFDAHKIGKDNIEEIYKAYISWWNHIRYEHENPREFISVKYAENKTQEDLK